MVEIPKAYQFRVDTTKGRFYAYIEADIAELGECALREFIEEASEMYKSDLSIKAIKLVQRTPRPTCITILKGPYRVFCGRDFWYALGRGVEYELKLAELEESGG